MKRSEVLKLRSIIETAVQSLDDETALDAVVLHPEWASGMEYQVGTKVRHGGMVYRCLSAHTAQDSWLPDNAPSLWTKVLKGEGATLPWQQPDSTNGYMRGDKVTHNGFVWISDLDNNVWEPGIYGWRKV
jgi:hypothetical protein